MLPLFPEVQVQGAALCCVIELPSLLVPCYKVMGGDLEVFGADSRMGEDLGRPLPQPLATCGS